MSQDHNHLNRATWECKYPPKYRKDARLLRFDGRGGTRTMIRAYIRK
jgi:hypothetical protein